MVSCQATATRICFEPDADVLMRHPLTRRLAWDLRPEQPGGAPRRDGVPLEILPRKVRSPRVRNLPCAGTILATGSGEPISPTWSRSPSPKCAIARAMRSLDCGFKRILRRHVPLDRVTIGPRRRQALAGPEDVEQLRLHRSVAGRPNPSESKSRLEHRIKVFSLQ
jgi:hypothetical protein